MQRARASMVTAAIGIGLSVGNASGATAQAGPTRGVVIGDRPGATVEIRQSPSPRAQPVFRAATGEIVTIRQVGKERTTLDESDDLCEAYPWVQVSDRTNRRGWIYGKYLFRVREGGEQIADTVPDRFRIDGTTYQLALTRNYGVGSWDEEEGLLGCEEFYPVVIHTPDWETASLLEMRNAPYSRLPYWNLVNDDGGSEEIVGLEQPNRGEVHALIFCMLQEGACTYRVRIFREGNRWIAAANDHREFMP